MEMLDIDSLIASIDMGDVPLVILGLYMVMLFHSALLHIQQQLLRRGLLPSRPESRRSCHCFDDYGDHVFQCAMLGIPGLIYRRWVALRFLH